MIYKLWYRVQDNGDGSVSVIFHQNEKEAEAAEEQDIEDGGPGWGESSVHYFELKSDSPILVGDYGMINGKYKKIFNLLEAEDETI